ncbi:molybdate ABC transporter substrate-binding protein [Ornithinimicrobium tianjinense]|uniref:Molybdate-binding protein n=1 Tax=Ornithinimicrobium tianjinense TaxID=1195761 RepID=A0A917BUA0_9MICO|nr:molybdate ABC transporter substrate-binding protein [Ornithinimicrobium tianjinense]GGF56141.1 molybdate-binding protein [Ornithinimicrobium tianjinense]
MAPATALTGRGLTFLLAATTSLALTSCEATAESSGALSGDRTVTVLAAASLTDVLAEIAADFEADHPGVTVETSFAASSTIVQQVNEGAPADVVALAGQQALEPLEQARRVSEPVVLTTNTLELAVPPDNPAAVDGVEDLTAAGLRLVVCQPEVPCGTAAATLFDRLGIDPQVASYEPDVRATLSKVALGEADVGVVYRTDVAAADGAVLGVEIPAQDNVVSSYPVLAVSGSPLALELIEEMLSARGQQHLADAGFGAP